MRLKPPLYLIRVVVCYSLGVRCLMIWTLYSNVSHCCFHVLQIRHSLTARDVLCKHSCFIYCLRGKHLHPKYIAFTLKINDFIHFFALMREE